MFFSRLRSAAATSFDLTQAIAAREGIPAEQQRLVVGGRPLRPDRTLAEQHVGAASTVELNLRLQGGAPKKGKGKDKKGKKDKGDDKGGKAPLGEVSAEPEQQNAVLLL